MILEDKNVIRSLFISLVITIGFVIMGVFSQKALQKKHDKEMQKLIESVNSERDKIIEEKNDEIYLLRNENDRISKEIYVAYEELIRIDNKLNNIKTSSDKKISDIKKMNNNQLEKYWRDELK